MREVFLRILSRLFLLQQRCSDVLRVLPEEAVKQGRSRGPLQNALLRCGAYMFSVMRLLIRPEMRSRIRIWLVRNLKAGSSSSLTAAGESQRVLGREPDGITLIGYLKAELGLGEGARSTIRAAKRVGIRLAGVDYRSGCAARQSEESDCELVCDSKYSVNLFHLNADQIYVAYNALGKDFFEGHYNIAYCVWEQAEFPEDWVPAFDLVDEVWTASRFCQDLISRKTNRPVIRIPHCVDPVIPDHIDRKTLGLPEDGFLFLAMADFFSSPERKNPTGVLDAFVKAFGSQPRNIYLVLKTMNSGIRKDVFSLVQGYRDRCASIILLDGYFARAEVNALINSCDCFISLHRAEGFGLPIAEAMCLGKPVIATGWSGNMDLMNVCNSFPVRYTIVELQHDTGSYRKGNRWAEPDIDHAAQLMQRVVAEPDLAASVGLRAREAISNEFSPLSVGRMIEDRLRRIRKRFRE